MPSDTKHYALAADVRKITSKYSDKVINYCTIDTLGFDPHGAQF